MERLECDEAHFDEDIEDIDVIKIADQDLPNSPLTQPLVDQPLESPVSSLPVINQFDSNACTISYVALKSDPTNSIATYETQESNTATLNIENSEEVRSQATNIPEVIVREFSFALEPIFKLLVYYFSFVIMNTPTELQDQYSKILLLLLYIPKVYHLVKSFFEI